MQIKPPLLSPVLFQDQADAGGTLREEGAEDIQELPLGALTMHFSPHLSNPVFLATCKLQVPMYLQSDTFSLLRKLQTREEIFPVLFNTRQLANYLNYSFVNITSFTQPLFAVSKKRAERPKLFQIFGVIPESLPLQGRPDGHCCHSHHVYVEHSPGLLQDGGLCMQHPPLSYFGLAIFYMNKYTQIYPLGTWRGQRSFRRLWEHDLP